MPIIPFKEMVGIWFPVEDCYSACIIQVACSFRVILLGGVANTFSTGKHNDNTGNIPYK